MDKKALGPRS